MILEVEKLDLYYGDAQALDAVSLSVAEGELVAIVGANGAGKSSLIRTIAGIESPRAGHIRLRGADITGEPSHRICNLGIGQVAEGRQIFPSLTVEENLEMGALVPRARAQMQATMGEVYALFPRLAERRRQQAGTMSGGEQQMLAIGRCLMGRPELIMFDEPSLGLAPALVQELFGTIVALNRRGLTVLLVEQNVAHSLKLADRGYVLENGRVALSGTGQELLSDEGVRHAYLGIAPEHAAVGTAGEPQPSKPPKPPFKPIEFALPLVKRRDLPGGAFELRSAVPLRAYAPSLAHLLRQQAEAHPDRDFLAERDASGAWRRLTYAGARRKADAIAQALIALGCGPDRPLMILSGNGIDHALLTFGAYVAGVPAVPVSVAYSQMSQDHDKLRHIFAAIRPRAVYASNGKAFARPLAALDLADCEVIVGADPADGVRASMLDVMLEVEPGPAVEKAFAAIGPDTVAKVLFTSGSTGMPKGVINTHRMMCSNQTMLEQTWPFLKSGRTVLVDWLPWNHTFGGNHNVNLTLAQAGTMYIDAGRPAPGLIEHTVRNLAEVSPTIYFNVPAGYGALLPYLEKDEALAQKFFADLKLIFYAGAALSQDLWDRLEAISIRTTGARVPMVSSWGATETAPIATCGFLPIERAGVIGLPPPGVTLKLVPAASKLEVRVKGPNVFPGYWGRPDLTQDSFDADGFYRIGDAVRLADPDDLSKGIVFDGRVAEDFKLSTGTWVHVGGLRIAALVAAAPVLQDAVVTGHDRDFVGLLAWPNLAAMKEICPDAAAHADPAKLVESAEVREHVRAGIARHNAGQAGTSMKIARVLIMTEPPSIDANEITDKGYINQRATLERRKALVERLHAEPAPADVITIE
jgi:feruloyl-CoA synthase